MLLPLSFKVRLYHVFSPKLCPTQTYDVFLLSTQLVMTVRATLTARANTSPSSTVVYSRGAVERVRIDTAAAMSTNRWGRLNRTAAFSGRRTKTIAMS
jgi:hypothetical protein